jgi:drug/metabolite transporter (DMT)-like permease
MLRANFLPPRFSAMSLPTAAAHANAMRGILYMLLGIVIFSIMDGLAKEVSDKYPTPMIMWVRNLAQSVFVLGLVMRLRRYRIARSKRPGLQIGRSVCNLGQAFLFIFALGMVPLADAVAIGMTGPLMLTAMSALILKEQVGIRRWSAVAVGCIGALIMVRPGLGVVHWAAMLVIAAAFINVLSQIGTRVVSEHDNILTTLFYTTVTGLVITTMIVPFVWVDMPWEAWAMMAAMGLLGGCAHLATNRAFTDAPASILAPMSYAAIPIAAVVGYIWFHQFPDRWTIVGATIVVGSGLYVIYRERVRRREREATG